MCEPIRRGYGTEGIGYQRVPQYIVANLSPSGPKRKGTERTQWQQCIAQSSAPDSGNRMMCRGIGMAKTSRMSQNGLASFLSNSADQQQWKINQHKYPTQRFGDTAKSSINCLTRITSQSQAMQILAHNLLSPERSHNSKDDDLHEV